MEVSQWDSDIRISTLERKLLAKSGQLQEAEVKIALLCATIEDRESHAAQLSLQVTEARKETVLARDEAAEAYCEAEDAREVAKAAEDVAAVVANDAQDIGMQASFKVLRQALLHMAPDFDVEAMDALVNMDMINTAVLEAKVEIGPSRVNAKGKGPIT